MRSVINRFFAIAIVLLVIVLIAPLVFVVSLPTTFACRTFVDASAEAELVYPSGQRLSYQSHEGTRQLIEMSSPQLPGFTAYLAIPADDQGAFRWFDDHLQALGWQPLNPESQFQVVQSSGETSRGNSEGISPVRFEAGRIPPGVGALPPDGQDLLVYAYFIQDASRIPACR